MTFPESEHWYQLKFFKKEVLILMKFFPLKIREEAFLNSVTLNLYTFIVFQNFEKL